MCTIVSYGMYKFNLLQLKRTRSTLSNRSKRQRYRANKKRKFFEKCAQSTSTCTSDKLVPSAPSLAYDNDIDHDYSLNDNSTDSSSVDHDCWKVYDNQAKYIRQAQMKKSAELSEKFHDFIDPSPAFPSDNRKVKLPASLSGIDRVKVSYQLKEMQEIENNALFQARFYRDRCECLEQKIRQLQTEKEGIRYFWRNQVFEGGSRSGRILKLAVSSRT